MLTIGHRGAPGVAPGNTMASFRAAREMGCDWVECDCRPSRDGIIVLAHDDHITDVSGRTFVIRECDADLLASLDPGTGEGVPTLAELVAWAGEAGVGVMADVKAGGWEREIGGALAPLPSELKVVPGADSAGRARFRALFPDLPISTTISVADASDIDHTLDALDTPAATPEHPTVTAQRVSRLHSHGICTYPWTVDDLDRMRELAAMCVDGIISNRADLLARL